MRVTHHGIVDNVIRQIQERLERLNQVQTEVTSGRRLNRAGDDPAGAARALDLQSRISRAGQYQRNLNAAMDDLQRTDDLLAQAGNLLTRARALAVQGANQSTSDQARRALAVEVDQLIADLVTVGNQRHGPRFVFGGAQTRIAPYLAVPDDAGRTVEVRRTGPAGQAPLAPASETDLTAGGVNADDVFTFADRDDAFQVLIDLRDALAAADSQAVGEVLERLDAASDQLRSVQALVGARVKSIQEHIDRLQSRAARDTEVLSRLVDTDLTESLTRLNEESTSYELALRTAAKVIQPSLVNFVYL